MKITMYNGYDSLEIVKGVELSMETFGLSTNKSNPTNYAMARRKKYYACVYVYMYVIKFQNSYV